MCSFEKELTKKLQQKASGAQSEEAVLLKAFKYFDLNNNGEVEPDEFAKAIEKIGIMIPTRQVSYPIIPRPVTQRADAIFCRASFNYKPGPRRPLQHLRS